MIEAQQVVIKEGGADGMGYITADNGLATFRRLLDETLRVEQLAASRAAN